MAQMVAAQGQAVREIVPGSIEIICAGLGLDWPATEADNKHKGVAIW